MSLPERLKLMGQALARPDPPLEQRLTAYLTEAAQLLRSLPLLDLLVETLGPEGAEWVQREMSGHLHVGFLAPAGTPLDLLATVAARCGFGATQARFASEILARELAWHCGRTRVPTMILKADAPPGGSFVLAVEAFVPEVEEELSRQWIEELIGVHLAVGLRRPESVELALKHGLARGYQPPPFLQGHAALNVVNEIRVIYLDGQTAAGPLRWEFYHSAQEHPLRQG